MPAGTTVSIITASIEHDAYIDRIGDSTLGHGYVNASAKRLIKDSVMLAAIDDSSQSVTGFAFGRVVKSESFLPEYPFLFDDNLHEKLGVIDIAGVDPIHQRKGIGAKLVASLVNYLKEKDVKLFVALAWYYYPSNSDKQKVNIGNVLEANGFYKYQTLKGLWRLDCESKKFVCPAATYSKNCSCGAIVYFKHT